MSRASLRADWGPLILAVAAPGGRQTALTARLAHRLRRRGLRVHVGRAIADAPSDEYDILLVPCHLRDAERVAALTEQAWLHQWSGWYAGHRSR